MLIKAVIILTIPLIIVAIVAIFFKYIKKLKPRRYIPKSSMPPKIYKNMVRDILEDTLTILYNHNYKPIIDGGTLLGIIRDNDIIDGDYDADILMPYNEFEKLKIDNSVLDELTKLYKLQKYKSRWAIYHKYTPDISFRKVPHLDIFTYYSKGKCNYADSFNIKLGKDIEKNNWITKSKYHKNIIKIPAPKNFTKVTYFYIPKDYENYLIDLYGEWKKKSKKRANQYTCK